MATFVSKELSETFFLMKTLVVVGHPHLEESTVSKGWVDGLRAMSDPDLTIHYLADACGSGMTFDVEAEKNLLREADRVILQFPLYWMSVPGVMKCWIDQVWGAGSAAGGEGTLDGKLIDLATSAGVPSEEVYGEGGLQGLFIPIISSIDYAGAKFGRIFSFFSADAEDVSERLPESVEYYKQFCAE